MAEITTNIINCRYNFNDDGIRDASEQAKDFSGVILKKNPKLVLINQVSNPFSKLI